jgi:outer membrane lipoprotein carrier protein
MRVLALTAASLLLGAFPIPRTGEARAAPAKPAAAKPAAAGPVASVLARMQDRYDKAADYRAKFAQKYTSSATGRERTSSGEVFIKKPGRMRFSYQTPTPSMYLSNGTTFWQYEPEAKQAFKQDLKTSQLPAAVAFLMGKGKLTDEFEVQLADKLPYGTPKDHKLQLKPKKPQSAYKAIYFVVDPATFLVKESILINAQGDINAFTFTDAKVDSKVPDDTFKWAPPPGVRIIEGAKPSK